MELTRWHNNLKTRNMLKFPDAKINLGLNIISKRPDGYHNLETVMIHVPSHDILEIVESTDGKDSLHCSGRPVGCPMEKNLVYKALLKMRERYAVPPVAIYLDKQTPDGAGLGGGSADAAYTLRLLNELFSLGATREEMAAMAASIGADCPFFIYDTPMLCTGTGTDLSPIDLTLPDGMWIVIVKPDVSVPTKEAYAGVTPRQPDAPLSEVLKLPVEQWQEYLKNDFEESVFKRYPVVADIKRRLIEAGALYASMSGSGSAVFGLFRKKPYLTDVKPFGENCCYLLRELN